MEQVLLIYIKLSDGHWGDEKDEECVFELEDKLIGEINHSNLGHYDGHEFGAGYRCLFMYGPSAEELWNLIRPIIKNSHVRSGSFVIMRGQIESIEERIKLPLQIN